MATIMLALFLAGCPLLRWTAASAVQNLSSVMDASGHCVCTVILPDDTFPLRRIEQLETSARNLTLRVQRELEKLQEYGQRLAWYEAKLQNSSRRLQLLEAGDVRPTELDFQELRKEIGEMESFVGHLRSSLNGSDATVEVVHRELFVTFCRPTNYVLPFINVRGKSLIDRRWNCPLIYLLRRTQRAQACELLAAPQWRGEPREDYVILAPRRWDRRSHKRSFACWKPQ